MTTFLQAPDSPIGEVWRWQSDVLVSDNGTEQRIDLCEFPKRSFKNVYTFDLVSDIRREMAVMLKLGAAVYTPLFQYQAKLSAGAALGAAALSFNANRTDLRDDGALYLFDRLGGEIITIDEVSADGCSLAGVTTRAYGLRSFVCPVRLVYSLGSGSLNRLNVDKAANGEFNFAEVDFNIPFVQEWNEATLTMLGDLPVLEARPLGTQFNETFESGAEVVDYGGAVTIRNPWIHAQQTFARTFKTKRVFNPDDWDMWRVFADYCKGSVNPFYLPTYREDFAIVIGPALGGTTMRLEGPLYRTDYFPYGMYKQIAIFTDAGVHYATVSAAVNSGGNTNITFTPALPGGAGWNTGVKVSLLLKCRIADDMIALNHYPLHTEVNMNIRTVNA